MIVEIIGGRDGTWKRIVEENQDMRAPFTVDDKYDGTMQGGKAKSSE